MPRNRSGGLAALGSSVRRTAPPSYASRVASRRTTTLTRRLVVASVALVSLVLVTVYFRESDSGGLHDAQSVAASALRPFEVGAERLARPFRDAYGYLAGLFDAKEENERLREQIKRLRSRAIQNATAARENARLAALLDFRRGATFPNDYESLGATVLSQAASRFDQQVIISVGKRDGVVKHSPVMTDDGLVGEVTKVAESTARVTLLTDKESAVSAYDAQTDAYGIVRHGEGGGDALVLDRVPKEERVQRGDLIVTSGRRYGELPSLYPRYLPIGYVTSVGQTDIDVHQQIQVRPFVDFSSLDSVLVLIRKDAAPAGP